jgi:hypothetical protein
MLHGIPSRRPKTRAAAAAPRNVRDRKARYKRVQPTRKKIARG